ncbi:hypothetical protein C900_01574 [Fulvivirga imtechensis AK7]|uniref:Uncharacterized protein n=1 Tax=Fulvivirga imtechensis AK7 TaxID=1237149 RepID=L8JW42_9BACT|nr:hypothetical protein [Fulvivirga imtechensis]ELR72418.1 hypothetical protein C900_01574 [Fulvivirga imtechensis AK7]
MKKAILVLILVPLITVCAEAQKVKYKDLYYLLDTRKYDEAEPFLREFLSDPKNVDHTNANFQMAVIYQEKAKKNDVLQETEILKYNIDSAIIYYQKTLTYLDEKEIKRNDEYYQAYKRRDIRTGKFGIKLADIQFDIEKKIEGLKGQKERISELKNYYEQMQQYYAAAQQGFNGLQANYPNRKILFLRADNKLLDDFDVIKKNYLQAIENFDKYKSALGKVVGSGYDQSLRQKQIIDYKNDGKSTPEYLSDNIDFWDFSTWLDQAKADVREKIFPLREQLMVFDQSLNKLREKMVQDSSSVAADINMPLYSKLNSELYEFDKEPLPVAMFDLKIADLKFNSSVIQNRDYTDSLDIMYQLEVVGNRLHQLNAMDSLVNILVGKDLAEECKNYKEYVDAQFGGEAGLQAFVKQKLDFVIEQKRARNTEYERIRERSRWLVAESDSIPLFDIRQGNRYIPLEITDETTSGLYFSGEKPAEGYFSLVERTRVPKVNIKFEVNSEFFNKANIEGISSKTVMDEAGQIYFVVFYTPKPEQDTYVATISKIYTSDGLAWTKSVDLAMTPKNFTYEQQAGEFIVEYDAETGTNGNASKTLVLDKKGNVKE